MMIVNETMARKVFGKDDPIGRRIRSWRDENVLREIVGVVSDVRYAGLASSETSLGLRAASPGPVGTGDRVSESEGTPGLPRRNVARRGQEAGMPTSR